MTEPSPLEGLVEKVAEALANQIGMRKGCPPIKNCLALMPEHVAAIFRDDAAAAIEAAGVERLRDALTEARTTIEVVSGKSAAVRNSYEHTLAKIDAALSNTSVPVTVSEGMRPEVIAFAQLMESKLRANDHKLGWKNDGLGPLTDRLLEEAGELERTVIQLLRQITWRKAHSPADRGNGWSRRKHGVGELEVGCGYHELEGEERDAKLTEIASEAADVGNFAMMIADVALAMSADNREGREALTAKGNRGDD